MNHIPSQSQPDADISALVAEANTLDLSGAIQAAANYRRSLRRVIAIAKSGAEPFEEIKLSPRRGPKVEFLGKALGVKDAPFHTDYDDDATMTIEVWSTPAGALVGASTVSSESSSGDAYEETRCVVVEPSDDADAMRCEIMDFFNWTSHARALAREMGWSFRRWVD